MNLEVSKWPGFFQIGYEQVSTLTDICERADQLSKEAPEGWCPLVDGSGSSLINGMLFAPERHH